MSRPININEQYRFFYNHPVNGQTQCYPAIKQLDTEWVREDSQIFYRKVITQKFVFVDAIDRGVTDFSDLYALDRNPELRCERLDFTIEILCDETWEPWFEGYIALVDGEFDVDRCVLEIPVRVVDEYTCTLENWSKNVNILDIEEIEPVEVSFQGVEEAVCCVVIQDPPEIPLQDILNESPFTDCIDVNAGWFFDRNEAEEIGVDPVTGEIIRNFCSYFYRELSVEPCDENGEPIPPTGGTGWEILENNCPFSVTWFRNPLIYSDRDEALPKLPNGRRLNEIIEYLVAKCNLNVVSDFFGINPENDAPQNKAYNYANLYLKDLIVFQITDIKIPFASQSATFAEWSLEEILEELVNVFNVFWIIEDGEMRIEHISYFLDKAFMLDLTSEESKKFIQGRHKYSYVVEELPQQEEFIWLEKSDRTTLNDFDAGLIDYDITCTFTDNENDVVIQSNLLTNALEIIENAEDFTNDALVLIASREGNIINSEGVNSGVRRVNGPLAWANLLPELHTWYRPQLRGDINGIPAFFDHALPKREQDEIQITICCEDLINTFKPEDLVKTQLGWGEIESVNYSDPSGVMTLVLRHK